MAERMVHVPVSLIERTIRAIRVGYGDVIHPDLLAELRGLLSQPTPTAEPEQYNGHNGLAVFADAARRLSEGKPATPPSIEDMAPGTTENPEGWPYSTDPANAKRCGEAYVGYQGGEGACEYLPDHPGRHWSARWGSWSL